MPSRFATTRSATVAFCKYAQESTFAATHMEALYHCLTTRAELRQVAREQGIKDEQLHIPEDGAVLEF